MLGQSITIWILSGVILSLLIFIIGTRFMNRKEEEEQFIDSASDSEPSVALPYLLNTYFVSSSELAFYKQLVQYLRDDYVICNKVGLKDVFKVIKGAEHEKMYSDILKQKHVDFLICRPLDLTPLFAIEVDDMNIDNITIQERDSFFDAAFHCANFPLVRVPLKHDYTMEDVKGYLSDVLSKDKQSASTH